MNRAERRRQLRPDREARTPSKTYIARGGKGEPNILGRVEFPPARIVPLSELRRGRLARRAAELARLRRKQVRSNILIPDIVA